MDSIEVKREFLRKTKELAASCRVAAVQEKLAKLAEDYNRAIATLERQKAQASKTPEDEVGPV